MTRRKCNKKTWLAFAVVVVLMSWFYSPLFTRDWQVAETAQVASCLTTGKTAHCLFFTHR